MGLSRVIVQGRTLAGVPADIQVDSNGVLQDTYVPVDLAAAAPGAGSVGVASATLVAANSSRKGLVIVNLSANNVSLGLDGNPAVLNQGITLTPNGAWTMDALSFTNGEVRAIAGGAGSAVAYQEFS